MNLSGSGVLAVAALAAVGVGGYLFWKNREGFNPASANNYATQGASAIVAGITGGAAAGGEDSVGGVAARFAEWVNGTDAKIEAMKRGTDPVRGDGSIMSVEDYYSFGAGA